MFKFANLLPFLIVLGYSEAYALRCAYLFEKAFKVEEFVITIGGKKQSAQFLSAAHENLTSNFEISKINRLLKKIRDSGPSKLSAKQVQLLLKFRQNTSFLRSIFQTSAKNHKSPHDFADFVRDFGVLKDLISMNDQMSSRDQAAKILKKYSELDFDSLINDTKPASRKSVQRYFQEILKEVKAIMTKSEMTVEEVHDVRKGLRDVLRYLQIQNEVAFASDRGSGILSLGKQTELQDTPQIIFLKKTNAQLGEYCDGHALSLLRNEITEETLVYFPEKIRLRVEHFLKNYEIQVGE